MGVGVAALPQQAQPVDPFYVKMLDKAEKELSRLDYPRAMKDLEIAAFGLAQNKALLAKAYVYLGICHYQAKNISRSEEYIRQAVELLGEDGLGAIHVVAAVQGELDRLLVLYNIQPAQKTDSLQASEPVKGEPKDTKTEGKTENAGLSSKTQPTAKKEAEKTRTSPEIDAVRKSPEEKDFSFSLDKLKEGDLVPLDLVESKPVPVKQVAPIYPASLIRAGIEGTIIVNALVSETGKVIKTEIIRGIKGAFELEAAAVRAVKQWEFEPATIKGIRVKVWLPVAIEFKKPE